MIAQNTNELETIISTGIPSIQDAAMILPHVPFSLSLLSFISAHFVAFISLLLAPKQKHHHI